jgi:hypothetical protein
LTVSAAVHRSLPPSWLIEPRLRRLPTTPAIIDRVVGARRRQVLWSALTGLAGLSIGVVIVAVEWSRAVPDPWRPGTSLLYFTILGSITGSLIGLARDGYAFADRNGPRVAQSGRLQ